MAKAWRCGIPPEVDESLATTPFSAFVPESGCPESLSYFDERPGPRHHDLVVRGRIDRELALLDVEGKADEPFGSRLVGAVFGAGAPGERARVEELSLAMFQRPPSDPDISPLRYQLLYGVYATAHLARLEGRRKAVFLVHEFQNETCSVANTQRNHDDLNDFLMQLGVGGLGPGVSAVGPI